MLTDEQIAKLKEANPGAELSAQYFAEIDREVVFKTPSQAEWDRFQSDGLVDSRRQAAVKTVVFLSVIFPDKAEFAALVARKPALTGLVFSKIADAVGVGMESTIRKL